MKNTNKYLKWVKQNKLKLSGLIFMIFITITVISIVIYSSSKPLKMIKYNEFIKLVENKEIIELTYEQTSSEIIFLAKDKTLYKTDNPKSEGFKKYLLEKDVKVIEKKKKNPMLYITILEMWLIGYLMYYFTIGMGKKFKSKNMGNPIEGSLSKVRFENIAGNIEAKEEMQFLVEFLKNPKNYLDAGAKLPKGVVLFGPPGTGKTITAKAIAGEAGVPFFSMSGSDFVEMYVGLGAKRVRDLFKKARLKAPCIIFIDEIDAVGGKRGLSDNSEKDQTLNAILNELDGFDGSEGIVVITATNRIETLDPALVRPGRFDKHIPINLPDNKDRQEILLIHSRNKRLAQDIDLTELAKMTIGFSGAGLESLLNESAILAVNRKKTIIGKDEIDDTYFKIVMKGDKKKNCQDRNKKEIEITAWHEAGHVLVAKLKTDYDVPKATIIPTTSGAGGVTLITPKKMGMMSKEELYHDIMISYGGRVAEFLLLGDEKKITTGASMDIKQSTKTLFNIITAYGMNDKFGMINLDEIEINNELIQAEAIKLSKELYDETKILLCKHKDLLKMIADKLIKDETISEKEIDEIINFMN